MTLISIALGLLPILLMGGCRDVPNPGERTVTSSLTTIPTVAPGIWRVDHEVNPVTGVETTVAYLEFQGRRNLYVRQVGKKAVECYIETDQFLETIDNLDSRVSTVQYRIDGGKVVRQGWSIGDNNEDLFYPGNCAPLVAQLRKAKSLAFEYRPSGKLPATITFDMTGFPDEFKQNPPSPAHAHSVAHSDATLVPCAKVNWTLPCQTE
jgi:hypothetical protein